MHNQRETPLGEKTKGNRTDRTALLARRRFNTERKQNPWCPFQKKSRPPAGTPPPPHTSGQTHRESRGSWSSWDLSLLGGSASEFCVLRYWLNAHCAVYFLLPSTCLLTFLVIFVFSSWPGESSLQHAWHTPGSFPILNYSVMINWRFI